MKKTISVGLVVAFFAIGAMATTSAISTAYADEGGDPNNSKKAQKNAEERVGDKRDKRDAALADDNPNNDNGPKTALENMFDGHGVEPVEPCIC